MTETAVEDQAQETQDIETNLSDFIGPDGSLLDGWKEALVPEELQGGNIYNTISNVKAAMKQLGHQDKLIGADKIVKPTEKSSPEEWEEYYKAGGRPEGPDKYQLQVPEGLTEYYDEDLVKEARTIFHRIGLNQKQADVLWEFEKKRLEAGVKQLAEQQDQAKQEAEKTLHERWGNAYEERLAIANRLIEENVPNDEVKTRFLENYGNDPNFADFLATIGQKFLEHKIPIQTERANVVEDEIKNLEATPGFLDGTIRNTNRKEHDRIIGRLKELYEKKYPVRAPIENPR